MGEPDPIFALWKFLHENAMSDAEIEVSLQSRTAGRAILLPDDFDLSPPDALGKCLDALYDHPDGESGGP